QKFNVGFVYVMTNKSMPNLVKIGFSELLPEDRATDLYNTSVPTPFDIEFRMMTSCPRVVERNTHERLSYCRVNRNREFFEISVEVAIEAIRLSALQSVGINHWNSSTPHKLN